ncbi:chalcone isomerase family protein [Alteromonas sp. C1M14]|uniref:chalcone isomerase family protein n=1 Tax=Alteromonas sp. C1M14 TaxID=2841567 RepID=UPI001C08563D|nr:chalcone isomerase family protein [Alteromonas sp. C1M14]MBU2979469.1 chalcone isomerase family protein [Alteromonas sp. C1M14]
MKYWIKPCIFLFCCISLSAYGEEGRTSVEKTASFALNDSTKVGSTRFTFMFWDIYDAVLYAPEGRWQDQPPYVLTLTYLREFSGSDIAKRSIKEMSRQGKYEADTLSQWRSTMTDLFPDVNEGDKISGVFDRENVTHFYLNGNLLGSIDDKDFSSAFFAIWLGEKTSEPKMRSELIGE